MEKKLISTEYRIACHYSKGHYPNRASYWFIYDDGKEEEVTKEQWENR